MMCPKCGAENIGRAINIYRVGQQWECNVCAHAWRAA